MDGAYGLELNKNVFSILFEMNFYSYLGIFAFFLGLQLVSFHWYLECSMSSKLILTPAFYFMIMKITSGCTFF